MKRASIPLAALLGVAVTLLTIAAPSPVSAAARTMSASSPGAGGVSIGEATSPLAVARSASPRAAAQTVAIAPRLMVATKTDRSRATALSGQSLSGSRFFFVSPGSFALASVSFFVNNPRPRAPIGAATRVDRLAPFDFTAQTNGRTTREIKIAQLDFGRHTLSAIVRDVRGRQWVLSASFQNEDPAEPTGLLYSTKANRADPVALRDAGLQGPVAIFARFAKPATRVDYALSPPVRALSGVALSKTVTSAPWDAFAAPGGTPEWETVPVSLPTGQYRLTATVAFADGSRQVLTSRFLVRAPSSQRLISGKVVGVPGLSTKSKVYVRTPVDAQRYFQATLPIRADGSFSAYIPPIDLTVAAGISTSSGPGLQLEPFPVGASGDIKNLVIQSPGLTARTVRVLVRDVDNSPIADVAGSLQLQCSKQGTVAYLGNDLATTWRVTDQRQVRSEADGILAFQATDCDATANLGLTKDSFRRADRWELSVPPADVDLPAVRLYQDGQLVRYEGQILDANGDGLPGVRLQVGHPQLGGKATTSGEDGEFSLALDPRVYDYVEISIPTTTALVPGDVSLDLRDGMSGVELQSPFLPVAVRVTGNGGELVEGAEVRFSNSCESQGRDQSRYYGLAPGIILATYGLGFSGFFAVTDGAGIARGTYLSCRAPWVSATPPEGRDDLASVSQEAVLVAPNLVEINLAGWVDLTP